MNSDERQSVVDLYKILYGFDGMDDDGLNDELARSQTASTELKALIDQKSRENHALERDVGFLDERIKLLIHNKGGRDRETDDEAAAVLDRSSQNAELQIRRLLGPQQYQSFGALFFLLQSEPQHVARLCAQKISVAEVDMLLETVMFAIFGKQFSPREEHLLLVVFQLVLASHFDATAEFSSLLRANTPVTRMMQSYTRRSMGQAYLHRLLSPALNRIIAADIDLDINPMHVYSDISGGRWPGITFKGQRDHPAFAEVQAEVERRFTTLQKYTSEFMDLIFTSIESIPYGIRWMAKQVRLLAQRKFPTASRRQLSSLLGGFFFLRYLNPAIVSPHSYLLVKGAPEGRARRNLTMLAKVVQLVANQSAAVNKESFTVDVSSWIRTYETPVHDFLHNMCKVPDFYESLELDQYATMQAPQRTMTVHLRDIVDIHHLLTKYQSPDPRIRELLSELGTPLMAVTARQARVEIQLPLVVRWDVQATGYTAESEALRANVQFLKTKNLLVMMRRMLPGLHDSSLETVIETATHSPDPRMADRGYRAHVLMDQYSEVDLQLLESEVALETSRLGTLREKIERETTSLRRVYATVCDRNEYLEEQLDVFRSYLANIRGEATGQRVFSLRRFMQRGYVIGSWPWSEQMSSRLQIVVQPRGGEGHYTLTLETRDSHNVLVELWFTLDDLLAINRTHQSIDLEFMSLRPQPLAELISS